jgi:hypothetical protein
LPCKGMAPVFALVVPWLSSPGCLHFASLCVWQCSHFSLLRKTPFTLDEELTPFTYSLILTNYICTAHFSRPHFEIEGRGFTHRFWEDTIKP